MGSVKTCTKCGETKPLEDFAVKPGGAQGTDSWCKRCKAEDVAQRRREQGAEETARAARAYRAGMRKGKCAVCGSAIDGYGICEACEGAVRSLGGLDGLKRAARAVKYLSEEGANYTAGRDPQVSDQQ